MWMVRAQGIIRRFDHISILVSATRVMTAKPTSQPLSSAALPGNWPHLIVVSHLKRPDMVMRMAVRRRCVALQSQAYDTFGLQKDPENPDSDLRTEDSKE